MVQFDYICGSESLKPLMPAAAADYIVLCRRGVDVTLHTDTLHRMKQVACMTGASIVYSDYMTVDDSGVSHRRVLIDCQAGALRDDFDFGSLMLIETRALINALGGLTEVYQYAAFYALRLALLRQGAIVRINEPLYDVRHREEAMSQFAYVDSRNREVQLEMEHACTVHLKAIGAYITPQDQPVDLSGGEWPVEASVVIPVRNRVSTIADAIGSALSQKTDFSYNVLVVDNYSTDGTSALIDTLVPENTRLKHIVPETTGLGIGGCWNRALFSEHCGRFAVQLDSDDLYSSPDTLQRIINEFYRCRCAMVVGAYTLTDFDKNVIPPGLIAHSEWTDENGRNNALRVNGLGAPRAFYTPVAREIRFPDTSYGEDYAMGLAISRSYDIGRIYDSLYLCRRWSGNSDASLSHEALNRNNLYKDRIRTWELSERIRLNQSKHEN